MAEAEARIFGAYEPVSPLPPRRPPPLDVRSPVARSARSGQGGGEELLCTRELRNCQTESGNCRSQFAQCGSTLDDCRTAVGSERQQREQCSADFQRSQTTLQTCQREGANCVSVINKCQQAGSALQTQFQGCERTLQGLQAQLAELGRQNAQLQGEIRRLHSSDLGQLLQDEHERRLLNETLLQQQILHLQQQLRTSAPNVLLD